MKCNVPEDVKNLSLKDLDDYVRERAEAIVEATSPDEDSWDDPEEWMTEAVELAHTILWRLQCKGRA